MSPMGRTRRSPPLLIAITSANTTNLYIFGNFKKYLPNYLSHCLPRPVTTGWIAFAAAVFCLWEEWSYFTSVYFFFISMRLLLSLSYDLDQSSLGPTPSPPLTSYSTIGFGDVTPAHPQYMIMTFFVVIVGLSLVSVCINVVQEKVSLVYMDFLNKMLQVLTLTG